MVGIPYRKKCHTCRRKKVKCDEQKPRCGQCRKACIPCEGYENPSIFLNQTSSSFRRSKKLAAPTRQSIVAVTPIPAPLKSQSWSHDALVADFFSECLPPPGKPCSLTWLRTVLASTKNEADSVRLALLSVATSWIGKQLNRRDLRDKALQMYTASIHRFRGTISASAPSDVLTTTALFIIYELFQYGSESSGWECHAVGASTALRSAGSDALPNDPYLQIFVFCRYMFMVQSLRFHQGKPAPSRHHLHSLESLKWHGGAIDPEDLGPEREYWYLIDLGMDAAELFHLADPLEMRSSDEALDLLIRMNALLIKTKQWRLSSDIGCSYEKSLAVMDAFDRFRPLESLGGFFKGRGPLKFPGKGSNRYDWTLYDCANNLKLMLKYWDIYLTILTGMLRILRKHPNLQGLGGSSLYNAESQDYQLLMRKATNCTLISLTYIIEDAEKVTQTILMLISFCNRSPWPSFGYMLELWSIGLAQHWHYEKEMAFRTAPPELKSCYGSYDAFRLQAESYQSVIRGMKSRATAKSP